MKLSIIIPAYNEADTIETILKKVLSLSIDKEVIVVDDGSTDSTSQILQKLSAQNPAGLKIIFQARNQGKGAAVRRGLQEASGEVVVIQDADLEYDPQDLLRLFQEIKAGALAVYGSRSLKRNQIAGPLYYLGGRFFSKVANLLYGTRLTDLPTCYKMVRTDIIKNLNLKSQGFEFCPELTAKLAKHGVKIKEIPISYQPRSKKQGKKISFWHTFQYLWTLIKYRL
jgi:glycosyltransferase involved in cell wall biosynthesis